MTAPQHAASRPWLTEVLDWLLSLAASLASRITPMIPRRVPRAAGGATGSPVAGAPEAPVPPSPPAGRGASLNSDEQVEADIAAACRDIFAGFPEPKRDTWVIHHEPPGSPVGRVTLQRDRGDGRITISTGGHVTVIPATGPQPVLSGPETTPLRMLPDPPVVRGWYLAWLAEHPEAEVAAA